MTALHPVSSDIAFTSEVKAIQSQRGSREAYANMERHGSWETRITPELKSFIEAQKSAFLATTNADGQPYIQHRGGPAGFLRVLDEHTIAFADFAGNRQYISTGNLTTNHKAHLFLIDYRHRRRVKVWGEMQVLTDDQELLQRLMPAGYRARGEQVMLFTVKAWDANCPQHIPQRFDAEEMQQALQERDTRIATLEQELQRYRRSEV